MAVKIRILHDYVDESSEAYLRIPRGTIVENVDIDPEHGDAWYDHPTYPGVGYLSLKGDFEVIEDE